MGIKFKVIISAIIIVLLLAGLTVSYFLFSDIESKETKEIKENCNVEVERFIGRKIFIIRPKGQVEEEKKILYFHGGAYMAEMSSYHWEFIEKLVLDTKMTVIIPDYPLTPKYTYKDVFKMVKPLYKEILEQIKPEDLILMGDSAGGGLSLALLEEMSEENYELPGKTILISPWLDVRLENEKIDEVQKKDKELNKETLKLAGIAYAGGEENLNNFLVSPIEGDISKIKNLTIFTEEKKAARTYYYDSKGNKCKKADAVKVVKKGTVLQKSTIRYFSDKNDYFKSQKFIYDCKQFFLKEKLGIDWSFEMDQQNRELAEKHIGKNNPKEEYIRQNNNLKGTIKDVCKAGDYMFECEKGETLKRFKEDYNITSFVTSKYEENKGKVNTFVKEMQSIYKDRVKNEVRKHNDINEDINFLQETDYIFRPVQENIISTYENETQTREKPRVIDFLKNKIYHLLERIENLIHLQDFLHIERKNQIEIEENKRTHNLIIKDNDYYKKQERQKDDIDLEL